MKAIKFNKQKGIFLIKIKKKKNSYRRKKLVFIVENWDFNNF